MAIKRPSPSKINPTLRLADYISGSRKLGEKYTAWFNYGQGTPDFGKGSGPGEPHQRITKTVAPLKPVKPGTGSIANRSTWSSNKKDPRTEAIRRRLRGM